MLQTLDKRTNYVLTLKPPCQDPRAGSEHAPKRSVKALSTKWTNRGSAWSHGEASQSVDTGLTNDPPTLKCRAGWEAGGLSADLPHRVCRLDSTVHLI